MMGEMAEYNLERIGEDEPEDDDEETSAPPPTPKPKPTKTIWVTRDGQRIPVKDMTDSHLINTIRLLRGNALPFKIGELKPLSHYIANDPPDGAYDAAMMEIDQLVEMDDDEYLSARIPTFDAMLAEAKRRKLEL